MFRPPHRSWAWPLATRPMSTASTLMRLPVAGMPIRSPVWVPAHGGPAGEPIAGDEQVVDGHAEVGERGPERGDLLPERLDALESFAVLGIAGGDELVQQDEVAGVDGLVDAMQDVFYLRHAR